MTRFELRHLNMVGATAARKFHASIYRIQKRLIIDRFLEEIHRAFFHRLHAQRQIAVARDKDNRCKRSYAVEFLLQL